MKGRHVETCTLHLYQREVSKTLNEVSEEILKKLKCSFEESSPLKEENVDHERRRVAFQNHEIKYEYENAIKKFTENLQQKMEHPFADCDELNIIKSKYGPVDIKDLNPVVGKGMLEAVPRSCIKIVQKYRTSTSKKFDPVNEHKRDNELRGKMMLYNNAVGIYEIMDMDTGYVDMLEYLDYLQRCSQRYKKSTYLIYIDLMINILHKLLPYVSPRGVLERNTAITVLYRLISETGLFSPIFSKFRGTKFLHLMKAAFNAMARDKRPPSSKIKSSPQRRLSLPPRPDTFLKKHETPLVMIGQGRPSAASPALRKRLLSSEALSAVTSPFSRESSSLFSEHSDLEMLDYVFYPYKIQSSDRGFGRLATAEYYTFPSI